MFNMFTPIECCSCHVIFGVTNEFHKHRRNDHKRFHCPSCGIGQSFSGPSEEELLRQERDRLKQSLAQRDDEIKRQRELRKSEERKVVAYKGVVTRTKKRIAGGACPCCNRTFQNLAQHMKTKHENYVQKDEVA